MCTVSWTRNPDSFELLCNRDEQRTRQLALEPRVEKQRGVRNLAPIDGDRGGTWLCANEFGIVICLLNGACLSGSGEAVAMTDGTISRGLIPLELADVGSSTIALQRLNALDLSRYAPFTLVVADPDLPVAVAEWTGAELALMPYGDPFLPLISSSVEAAEVRARRRAEFASQVREGRDSAALRRFHESHQYGLSAYSPCMHRPDAETVSHSVVEVTDQLIEFRYSPGSPCRAVPAAVRTLERVI